MSTSARPVKRIYLINRDFQLRYALAAVVVGAISTLLTITLLLVPLYYFEILRIPTFLPLPILSAIFLAAAINIFLIGLLGVFITHRIAGPMYNLVKHFRRVELGRWSGQVRIRENDDLRYLVRNFNQMLDGLARIGDSDVAVLDNVLEQVQNRTVAVDQKNIIDELKVLRDEIAARVGAKDDRD